LFFFLPRRIKKLPSVPQIDTEFDPHQG